MQTQTEPNRPAFRILRGWIDAAGKCRTWTIAKSDGERIAEVTRKRDALRLVLLLTEAR